MVASSARNSINSSNINSLSLSLSLWKIRVYQRTLQILMKKALKDLNRSTKTVYKGIESRLSRAQVFGVN
jgi:hypothetical protein